MDARYRVSNTNWDQMIANSSLISGSTITQNANLGNNNALNNVVWDFSMVHTAGTGFAFTLSRTVGTTLTTSTVRYTTTIAGNPAVTPLRSFNAIEMYVEAGTDYNTSTLASSHIQATNLAFNLTGSTQTGSLITLRDDLDDVAPLGDGRDEDLYKQFIVADADLSQFNWSVTGQLQAGFTLAGGATSAGSLDERLKFDIKALNVTIIPAPAAASLTLAGLAMVGLRRRR